MVRLKGTVRTNQGRRFPVDLSTTADARGSYTLRVFYPTLSLEKNEAVGIEGGYTLIINGLRKRVNITEEDVIQGTAIRIGGGKQESVISP